MLTTALQRLASRYPNFPCVYGMLCRRVFPGLSYLEVLSRVHRRLVPRNYLEIGVEHGASIALATTAVTAVGIDPHQKRIRGRLRSSTRLYRMTSDAFFASQTVESVFNGEAVDLAFIDGLHLFEYALRDFINIERWSSSRSTIVLHDALPITEISARRERASAFWVGDVWKVVEILLAYRPDLQIRTLLAPPSGLVVIRRLSPSSTRLADNYTEIVERFAPCAYPYDFGQWPHTYGLLPSSEVGIDEALDMLVQA